MFRNVPGCSEMFHVPGFVNAQFLCPLLGLHVDFKVMELYQIVMVIIGLYQVLITVYAKPAGNDKAVNYGVVHTVPYGGLKPDYHMALRRHVFKTLKVQTSLHCLKACDNDVRCQSINQVMGKGICELNNRTKEARPGDLIIDNTKLYVPRQNKRGEHV